MSDNDATPADLGLPEKPRRRGGAVAVIAVVLIAVVAAVLYAVNSGSDDTAAGRTKVRIGVTDASKEYWKTYKELAAEQGIDLETVNFSDYHQANPALSQRQIDLNLFQHVLFLANYDVSNDDTLTPIGSSYVVPLSLYSQKHTDVAAIPQGGTVAVPNDKTNQARALLVLQQAGLIKLKGGGTVLSTPADIDTAASKVTVVPVDAAQTVASLPSVDGAIVNNNFALDADLDPSAALFGDDPNSPDSAPYINVFVTRAEDKDNPVYHKLVELYRDKRVADQVLADSKGTSVSVDRTQAELEGILAGLTETVRGAK
ncbi:D-methionine transport system substrate-binding protein [Saccharopolyspora antimicrobica]|uniref:D-methionine transport system substrate-binding protein n=1 Tax=Saccharopolyspora antimicrobica TaxID=455193 RepID=A0A1I5LNI0_9PSEU|nr:MetQ/NlpA family ABC transporter substrate-binding protein [Saccharopolyspora antimicrobica]RKT87850.1 D-methionine transport system substrate-binding protein [Saccharopolyspora antimicrobica]SFO98868.1 D-methionine transport system substrate-binding protein [Saccharopolyspora antimicrobica]